MKDQILRPKEAAKFLGIGLSTLYLFAKKEGFPKKVRLGARSVGWWMEELKEWVKRQNL